MPAGASIDQASSFDGRSIRAPSLERPMKQWDRSVAVLGLIALTIALVNEALTFGAGDNQYIRFALWIEITIASMAALIFFALALNDFGIRLQSEPSTYLSVLAVLLTVVFCVIRREPISWESSERIFKIYQALKC
jgi:hypothetical protein